MVPFLTRPSHSLPAFHPQNQSSSLSFWDMVPSPNLLHSDGPRMIVVELVALHVIHYSNISLETGIACTALIENESKHWWLRLGLGTGMSFNIIDICTSRGSLLLNLSKNAINSILPVYEDIFYRNTIYCTSTTCGYRLYNPCAKGMLNSYNDADRSIMPQPSDRLHMT